MGIGRELIKTWAKSDEYTYISCYGRGHQNQLFNDTTLLNLISPLHILTITIDQIDNICYLHNKTGRQIYHGPILYGIVWMHATWESYLTWVNNDIIHFKLSRLDSNRKLPQKEQQYGSIQQLTVKSIQHGFVETAMDNNGELSYLGRRHGQPNVQDTVNLGNTKIRNIEFSIINRLEQKAKLK